jgi:hypothetical protein
MFDELKNLAPIVHAVFPSDRACCERLENLLAAELSKQDPLFGRVADVLSLLSTFECRSPRLAEILRSAASHDDPETRWRAAAMLETISSPPNHKP